MNLALLFLSMGPALEVPPPPEACEAQATATVTTYDAFVATEETPRLRDLKHPAIQIRASRNKSIAGPVQPLSIV